MNYAAAIERVYDHLENDHVDQATMTCFRIARNRQDYLYSAVFLREMYPNKRECLRILMDDIGHLKKDERHFIWDRSAEYWLDTHTIDFSLGDPDDGEDRNVLAIGVSEIDPDIDQSERAISDLQLPPGMGEYDTAAFTDRYVTLKSQMRLRIRALLKVRDRIKTRCLNYAIRVERQIQAQRKAESFLARVYTDVNNYFEAHSEDVYKKLQKAAQLVDSTDDEDYSLLLTEVRRAIKSSADFFYPPKDQQVICFDGEARKLGEDQYMNRLQEFVSTSFEKTSSRRLLEAELTYLTDFARRLNDVSSKGVHAEVNNVEAKQGLLGLYLFLYNLISRIQIQSSEKS